MTKSLDCKIWVKVIMLQCMFNGALTIINMQGFTVSDITATSRNAFYSPDLCQNHWSVKSMCVTSKSVYTEYWLTAKSKLAQEKKCG